MTRETKVALLIGTGVILVIGIVVSDQFTRSKPAQPAPDAGYSMDAGLPATPDSTLSASTSSPLTGLDTAPINLPAANPGAAITIGNPPATYVPAAPSNNTILTPGTLTPLPGAVIADNLGTPVPTGVTTTTSITDAAIAIADAPSPSYPTGSDMMLFPTNATPASLAASNTSSSSFNLGPTGSSPSSALPSSIKTVKVQSGDTLEKIAKREMGAGKHWKELQKANASVLKGSDKLKIGMELTIPELKSDAASSSTASATPGLDFSNKSVDAAAPSAPRSTGPKTYTVKSGDTLSAIAKRELGSANKWKSILNANKRALKNNGGELRPGMKLTIPAEQN